MGRLVRIARQRPREGAAFGSAADRTPLEQDDYLLRLAKYVPAEVLGFSILINAILDQALRSGGKDAAMAGIPVSTIAIAALVLGTAMSPFYVWYVHQKGDAWVTNALVSFVAFPFWSYALGAVAFVDYRDGNLAAIVLASFTMASGLITPLPFEPKRTAETNESEPALRDDGQRPRRSAATAARRLVDVTSIPMPGPDRDAADRA
jgi:hypothetical protein